VVREQIISIGTLGVSKQLLPIFDKPMIYYPLSVLMLSDIRDILIISTPDDLPVYQHLLGDGSKYGVSFEYEVQSKPEGLAQSFIIGEKFIGNQNVTLILGDNIFYGQNFSSQLVHAKSFDRGANVFGYYVEDPSEFGVIEFDDNLKTISIEEKPRHPKSNYAVTGLYFYDNDVVDIAKSIQPSDRGELEITDVNNVYIKRGDLRVSILGRGFAWLDTGNHNTLLEAGQFIQAVEHRQGLKVACLEEIAFLKGWITESDLEKQFNDLANSGYGQYLGKVLQRQK
jgi:glucose-1-phosphate thymidylyltransferase, short form